MSARGRVRMAQSQRDRDVALAGLFDRHFVELCRVAYLILGDAGVAEEIAMEAFAAGLGHWRDIRDPERASAYLRRAVLNLCRSRIRRRQLERRIGAFRPVAPLALWDPERHALTLEVWDAVRALPTRQRACVVLRYYLDLPEADIADTLGCAPGTVKSQLAKARGRLANRLDKEGPT